MTGSVSSQAIAGLRESYVKWRASQLGRITDALETELILELLGPVAGLKLLDVGCGDGVFALELARRGANVTGLNANADVVTAARKRAEAESAKLNFVEGAADRLPFDDAAFDGIVAVTVLCFVPDAEGAVTEMARVLKPGGRLVIGELGRWSLWAMQRRIRGCSASRRGVRPDFAPRRNSAGSSSPPVWNRPRRAAAFSIRPSLLRRDSSLPSIRDSAGQRLLGRRSLRCPRANR